MGIRLTIAIVLNLLVGLQVKAQNLSSITYEIGDPALTHLYVNSNTGSDSASGVSSAHPLKTISAAWNKIPQSDPLTVGYKIHLAPGSFTEAQIPNYWEDRHGTYASPIIFEADGGAGSVTLKGDINMFGSSYIYFVGITIAPDPAGDAFHCEQCDHILLREVTLDGGVREAHETVKINQSQYIYIEDSVIHGADDNAIDFVSVQYGHIVRSKIYDAQDWCIYVKGGSSYLVIEGNEIYNCGTGGFTAGQGSGLEFITSPWLHYEAYDIKAINNIIHDTEGAGLGVNGGYNILLAYNTLYRVGSRSHALEVVFGARSCDGDQSACSSRISSGGWGTTDIGTEGEPIPNRNVYIYNNVIYNPSGFQSGQHFAVYGPRTPGGGSNIPSPATTDTNLKIRGNLIWNGTPSLPLGIEDSEQGCQDSNPTCNAAQLTSDNAINSVEPAIQDPESGDFRPVASGNLFSSPVFSIPTFDGGDRPSTPASDEGELSNAVSRDYSSQTRSSTAPPGAYATADAELSDQAPTISTATASPRKVKKGKRVNISATVTDDNAINSVTASVAGKTVTLIHKGSGIYKAKSKALKKVGKFTAIVTATDSADQQSTLSAGMVTVKK